MGASNLKYDTVDRAEFHGLHLRLATDLRRFGAYRTETATFLRHHLECEETVADLVMVLDEACTNVVRHSYGGSADRCFYLEVVMENWSEGSAKLLTITLRDQGPGGKDFSPDRSVAEAAARCASGDVTGFGLVMLYQLMDQVEYETAEGGENRLVMRKFFPAGQDYQYVARLIEEMQALSAEGRRSALTGETPGVLEARVPPAAPCEEAPRYQAR